MRKVGMAVVLLATGLVLPALSSSSAQALSLIHISEPTRPY